MNALTMRHQLLTALFSAMLISSHCQAEPPGKFASLKKRYAEELEKTREERRTFVKKLKANYLISLETYEAGRRKVSDLDAMIAVRDEKLRLEKDGTVKPSDVVEVPATLGALQKKYVAADAKHAGSIGRREIPVHRRYVSMLESLQKEFANAVRLEDAILVRDEIARVRNLIPQEPSSGNIVNLSSSLRDGLELHLGFDRPNGLDKRNATTSFDRSGRRNHAAVEGMAKWVADGQIGGGFELSGGSDRVISPTEISGQGTVCAWFRPKKTLDASTPQLDIVRTRGRIGFFVVNWARDTGGPTTGNGDNGAIDFSITPTHGAYSVCSTKTTEWRAGTWYFLCCTWDGKQQRLYVNGKLEGKREQAQSHRGSSLVVGSSEFKGTVDEVMKWDRALSSTEVANVFEATGGKR